MNLPRLPRRRTVRADLSERGGETLFLSSMGNLSEGVRPMNKLVLGSFLLAFGSVAVADVPLSVELSASGAKSGSSSQVLRWSITNHGAESVLVLRWETPLDGLSRSLFNVQRGGVDVPYVDKIVHWGHPEARDFVEIRAGETLSANVRLDDHYAMTRAGDYQVAYRGELTYMLKVNRQKAGGMHVEDTGEVTLEADAVSLRAAGRTADWYATIGMRNVPVQLSKALGYASCSSSQQNTINTAHNSAKTYASNSLAYLNAGSTGPRYTTWFGSYSATRYSTVKSHFSKINNVLQNLTTTYDCYCTPSAASAYAYVYPNEAYRIHLCNAFWAAPNTGTDSRAGTIIHEQSHFTVNGGTDDHAYGQTAAKKLARTNPTRATDNADNHEYFAENTPAQN